MSSRGGIDSTEVLVVTAAEGVAESVVEGLEASGVAAEAAPLDGPETILDGQWPPDADAVVLGDGVPSLREAIERLSEAGVPAVLLTDGDPEGPVATALEAGVADVFPPTSADGGYELLAERIAAATDGVEPAGGPPGSGNRADDPGDASGSGGDLRRASREIFENVGDGLVVHDPDTGAILDANERFCEMNGYDRTELVGENVGVVTAPGEEYSYEAAQEMIDRAREEGTQLFEWRNQHADGDTFPVEVHLAVVEIDGNERVLASVREITERKRRQREFEQIFHGVNDVITIHDPETAEIVGMNDSFPDLLGYDREAILEMGIAGYSHSSGEYTMERAREFVRSVVESGESRQTEWAVETADGDIRWLEVHGTTAEIGGERRFVAIDRDVTERRRSQRRFETIAERVEEVIYLANADMTEVKYVNAAYEDVYGRPRNSTRTPGRSWR